MDQEESRILEALDRAVRSEAIKPKIDVIVAHVEQKLQERPDPHERPSPSPTCRRPGSSADVPHCARPPEPG